MKFIIGKKQNMTQIFSEDGSAHPVTVIATGPAKVVGLRTEEKDGYKAVVVGFGDKHEKNVNKPQKVQYKDLGTFAEICEFRTDDTLEVGSEIKADSFAVGDVIEVSGISKGKGFQSVIKRHGFAGGPRSHGQKHSEREPGSIGGGLRNRVPKGMRMAGRMGSDRVTVKSVKVMAVDSENNLLYVKGALPGRRGTVVEIRG